MKRLLLTCLFAALGQSPALANPYNVLVIQTDEHHFKTLGCYGGKIVGRGEAEKKRAGETIFEATSAYLSDLLERPHFALSLEIREIAKDLSWKRNAMHPRLRKQV